MEFSEMSEPFSSRKVIDFFEEMLINGERAAMIENSEAKGIYITNKYLLKSK
jgi:hypothetical protein